MKIFIVCIASLFSLAASAQTYRQSKDTLFVADTVFYVKGGFINLGSGSKPDGGYTYIYTAPQKVLTAVVMPVPLQPGWDGFRMIIKGFKEVGNDVMGKKWYLILSSDGKKLRFWCDPVLAKKANEIK